MWKNILQCLLCANKAAAAGHLWIFLFEQNFVYYAVNWMLATKASVNILKKWRDAARGFLVCNKNKSENRKMETQTLNETRKKSSNKYWFWFSSNISRTNDSHNNTALSTSSTVLTDWKRTLWQMLSTQHNTVIFGVEHKHKHTHTHTPKRIITNICEKKTTTKYWIAFVRIFCDLRWLSWFELICEHLASRQLFNTADGAHWTLMTYRQS